MVNSFDEIRQGHTVHKNVLFYGIKSSILSLAVYSGVTYHRKLGGTYFLTVQATLLSHQPPQRLKSGIQSPAI